MFSRGRGGGIMNGVTYPEEKQVEWRAKVLKKFQTKQENPTKIYLACPYTHESKNIRERRFIIISYLAAHFTNEGYCVYTPILNGHTMVQYIDLPHDYEFWETRDKQFLRWANEFWQVRLDGWGDSTGMARELTYARLLGKTLKTVQLEMNMNEREFSMECLLRKIRGDFSDKLNLKIVVKEMS